MSDYSMGPAASGPTPYIKQTPNLGAATQACEAQQYRTAAQMCSNILQQNPTDLEASLLLAKVLSEAANPVTAVEVLQGAVTLVKVTGREFAHDSATQMELLRQLGICQTAAGRYEDAVDSFQRASVLVSAKVCCLLNRAQNCLI